MGLFANIYWLIILMLFADGCYSRDSSRRSALLPVSSTEGDSTQGESCLAAFCSSLMSSLDTCFAKNCQLGPNSFDETPTLENLNVIPVPVAVSRRLVVPQQQSLITFCPDVWPSVRYCTNYACYVVTLTHGSSSSSSSPVRQIAGSRKCVRDRCNVESGCILEQCCVDSAGDDLEQLMSRKRRVNDDVSQCIQSYCSGKLFRERILCIVKNCNRSA